MKTETYKGKIISVGKESVIAEIDGVKREFTYPILFEGLKDDDVFVMDVHYVNNNSIETKVTKINSDFPIREDVMNKIIRKKIIWAEIKAKEQEYIRLQKQINELQQAQKDISFEIQKRVDESQSIAEWLDEKEYEALKKLEDDKT